MSIFCLHFQAKAAQMLSSLIYVLILLVIHSQFGLVDQYMDEIFHYPQLLVYSTGNYTQWDPKITTPPGLYIGNLILGLYDSVAQARLINILYGFGLFVVLRCLRRSEFEAFVISCFPVSFYFQFLYYTDTGSSMFTLAMVMFGEWGWYWLASMCGLVAIVFRQTNVVWVLFTMGVAASKLLKTQKSDPKVQDLLSRHFSAIDNACN
jgi:alpha-1,2-glucosyltransferase